MSVLFAKVFQMSLTGSFCVLVVLAARLLLRKFPRRFSYALWALVFLRLICPVFPDSSFSLIPASFFTVSAEPETALDRLLSGSIKQEKRNAQMGTGLWVIKKESAQEIADFGNSRLFGTEPGSGYPAESADLGSQEVSEEELVLENEQQKQNVWEEGIRLFLAGVPYLWLLGTGMLLFYHGLSYWKLKERVAEAVEAEAGVYELPQEHLSFVLGIFRPAVYVSAGLSEKDRAYILCHERVHLKRKDYLIKPLALIITCMHWFNPFVWLAFRLMNQDMEISCDEQVVQKLGEENKKDYSRTLLAAAAGRRGAGNRKSVCALLSFGEDSVKARIRHVLQYKKASFWAMLTAFFVLVLLTVLLLADPPVSLSEEEFTAAVQKAGGYDSSGNTALCFVRDYDGNGRKEAFVEIGSQTEQWLEGDLWFVSEEGEAQCLRTGISMKTEQEYLEHEDGSSLLVTYIDGNPFLTAVFDVQDGRPVEQLPTNPEEKYVDGQTLVILASSYDLDYDREIEQFTGHTYKPYGFYYEDGAFWPYVADEISREEVKKFANGQEILWELEQEIPGCRYQYLLRENGLLHINRAKETEETFTFSYVTYELTGNRLEKLEEGEGCYKKDLTAPHEETFASLLAQETPDSMSSWMGPISARRAFGEEIRRLVEQEDVKGLFEKMADSVQTNLRSEPYLMESEALFAAEYETIFSEDVKNAIQKADLNTLFSSWRGICMGDGVIWFQPVVLEDGTISYQISAINQRNQETEPKSDLEPEAETKTELKPKEAAGLKQEWQELAEEKGILKERADAWYEQMETDGFFLEESYRFSDLHVTDLDGNGQTDMAFVLSLRPGAVTPASYEAAWLGIYMNGALAYKKAASANIYYALEQLLSGDVDQDGHTEIVYTVFTGGVGGAGSYEKEILKYRDGQLIPMDFPDDLDEEDDTGLQVQVRMGQGGAGAGRYTAYCPYLKESISFEAENRRNENGELFLPNAREGEEAGGNVRGYVSFAIQIREGRPCLQAQEYLCGEGGPSHGVGMAKFLLSWDADGRPDVTEFYVEPL